MHLIQAYLDGQEEIEREIKKLNKLQERVQNLREITQGANQEDADYSLHEISQHLCATKLEECIRTAEDLRQWEKILQIKVLMA